MMSALFWGLCSYCRCPIYYEIRGRYHCMFREGFGPVSRVMNYEDQRCLGLFLKELCRHRQMLLQEKKSHTQDPIERPVPEPPQNTFPQSTNPRIYNKSVKGTLLERATEIGKSRRPRPHHRRRRQSIYHRCIQAIIERHRASPMRVFTEE